LITENQDQFVQMLNEPADAPVSGAPVGGSGGQVLPPFAGGAPMADDSYIQVTQEEKQAIDRVFHFFFSCFW
jgi:hypothetical protein